MSQSPSTLVAEDPLHWFRRNALMVAIVGWALFYGANAAIQTALVGIAAAREPGAPEPWQIATWEWSSGLALYVLVPLVGWSESRFPLAWGNLRRSLLAHVGVSIVYSVLHVAIMVGIREVAYAIAGGDYRFGPVLPEWIYEYLKDCRSYAVALLILHVARLLLRRSQGEASIPGALPEPGVPEASVPAGEPPTERRPERFVVRKLGKDFLVPAAEIEFAIAAGNYVNLRVKGKDYPLRSTLAALEAALDPTRFVRVHRSVVVNIDQVSHVEPLDSGDARLAMRDGTQLSCSRRFKDNLLRKGQ